MSEQQMTFYQGDTSDVFEVKNITVSGVIQTDLTGFSATLEIRKAAAATALVTKSMTASGATFTAFLTPTESELLAAGKYIAVAKVQKTSVSFKKQYHKPILVLKKAG